MGGLGGGARASRPLWPPPPPTSHSSHLPNAPPLIPLPMPIGASPHDGVGRFGVYSVFPAGGHAPSGAQRFTTTSATHFHKVSESLFSAATGSYAMGGLGAPTPPPGSPYSPLHLEVVNTYNHHNTNGILIEQQQTESVQAFKKLDETKYITSRQQQQQCFTANPVSIAACCGPGDMQNNDRCWDVRSDMNSNGIHPLTIKTENVLGSSKKSCNSCVVESPKKTPHFMTDSNGGCSRTNPVTWSATLPVSGINNSALQVQVKREPHLHDAIVKMEQNSPTGCVTKLNADLSHLPVTTIAGSINNGSIPVGIAVARQRPPHELGGAGGSSAGLMSTAMTSHGKDLMPRFADMDGLGGALVGVTGSMGSGPGDDSPWGSQQQPSTALWQYPPQVAVESMVGLGALGALGGIGSLGAATAGLQLVRDPNGTLLFIPATEQYQQAVVWGPGYGGMGAGVILPPPLAPLQFLGAELLTASTTLHHHTSTRLVARTAPPQPPPPVSVPQPRPQPIIKMDDQPPPETGFLLYQLADCRSRPQSPSLTPPPDGSVPPDVQDASNQTDTPNLSEEEEINSQSNNCGSDCIEDVKHFTILPQKTLVVNSDTSCSPAKIQVKVLTSEDYAKSLNVSSVSDCGTQFSPCDSSVQTKLDISRQVVSDCIAAAVEDSRDSNSADRVINGPLISGESTSQEIIDGDVTIVVQSEGFANQNPNDVGATNVNDIIEQALLPEDSTQVVQPIQQKQLIQVDLSGLELLSNSIEQFETRTKSLVVPNVKPIDMPCLNDSSSELSVDVRNSLHPPPIIIIKTSPKSPKPASESANNHFNFPPIKSFKSSVCEDSSSLGGLNLLCALAEQRFREEEEERRSEHGSVSTSANEENNHDEYSHVSSNIKSEKLDRSYQDSHHRSSKSNDDYTSKRKFENDRFKMSKYHEESTEHRKESEDEEFLKKDRNPFQLKAERDAKQRRRSLEKKSKESFSVRTSGERKSFDKLKRELNQEYRHSDKRRLSDKTKCRTAVPSVDKTDQIEEALDPTYSDFAECSCKQGEAHTCEERSSWMNKMHRLEQDMILKLEDLQRQYREQQIELNKLTTKKTSEDSFKRGPGRPRKKSTASDKVISPPVSESRESFSYRNKPAPGIFTSSLPGIDTSLEEDCAKIPVCNLRLAKLSEDENSSMNDLSRESLIRSVSPVADSTSSQSSITTLSSSKKRKVGRPKKLLSTPGSRIATETIVAKKPKSKSSLVGYLLAAKRLNLPTNKGGIIYSKTNPPRPYEDEVTPKKVKNYKGLKLKTNLKPTEVNCYSSPASSVSEYKYPVGYDVKQKYASLLSGESNTGSKMRPKLKAEPKLKDYSEEDEVNNDWCGSQSNLTDIKSQSSSMESLQEVHLKNKQKTDQLALKHKKVITPKIILPKKKRVFKEYNNSSDSEEDEVTPKKRRMSKSVDLIVKDCPDAVVNKPVVQGRCALMLDQIGGEDVRVLTAMGGLFYAGLLRAVRAPDVYAVTLDRERGNRPHILSREETLRDTILEVLPTSTVELVPGTRLCAYWSQQYRCLYPGTVAEPSTPDPLSDDKFVPVEFDDGDSGRIAIEDIRLLQPDYPIVEYDLNPLLTLTKRRRQTSVNSTDDKKINTSVSSTNSLDQPNLPCLTPKTPNLDVFVSTSEQSQLEAEFSHRERKRLKKYKKEKLKRMMSRSGDENTNADDYIRKKKKKHKCCDDHCKHRKHHKKHHRKHKRHHHSSSKEHSESSSEDPTRSAMLATAFDQSPFFATKDVTVKISTVLPTSRNSLECSFKDTSQDSTSINEAPVGDAAKIVSKKKTVNKKTSPQKGKRPSAGKKISITDVVAQNGCLEIAADSNVSIKESKPVKLVKKIKITAKGKNSKKQNLKDSGIGMDGDDCAGLANDVMADDEEEEEDDQMSSVQEESPTAKVNGKKGKKRSSSCASEGGTSNGGASKMAAFLPAGAQLWGWTGTGLKRRQARGRARKCFYRTIQRASEVINVGDSAVFLSTGRPDRPYIGQVESMWEGWQGNMAVKVRWYYHPEETIGCPGKLTCPGGLFESPHTDENDVQTISHRCEVLPLSQYKKRLSGNDNNDTYYLAGHYDPTHRTLTMQPDVPISNSD